MEQTKRIALSPWARAALPVRIERQLEARAAEVGCYVSTVKRSRDSLWMARAFTRNTVRNDGVEFLGQSVADAVLGAIDKFEAQQYTAEELVQIYRQSNA